MGKTWKDDSHKERRKFEKNKRFRSCNVEERKAAASRRHENRCERRNNKVYLNEFGYNE